jgi:hypothetical protein
MAEKQLEPIWHAQIAILCAVILQLAASPSLSFGPRHSVAILEIFLVLSVGITRPKVHNRNATLHRLLSIGLIVLISVANIFSLILLSKALIDGTRIDGHTLILSAMAIYLTNIIMFGLWYWELDSTGLSGFVELDREDDFLFPQMSLKKYREAGWDAKFIDYLYVSTTNATAFSPTDALPLTHRAKLLMTTQSLTSLLTIALVAARAVNILS